VRSAARAKDLLACGLDRVILGTVALELPELVDQLAADRSISNVRVVTL
jgi:phosphoribosylformimino-5-aminoimidazole carboxamide ribotide isomerase